MAEDHTRGGLVEPPRVSRGSATAREAEGVRTLGALDELTGLRNQRALWRELRRRSSADILPLCVVMIDLDHLDAVNDRHGRDAGDAVLRTCATVLRGAGMSPRLAFRDADDRFVVLVPGGSEVGRTAAEEVRLQIEAQRGQLPDVTVSCGVAAIEQPVEPWVAIDRADAALAEAKAVGGNSVVVKAAGRREIVIEQIEHETPRRAALALSVATETVRTTGGSANAVEDVVALSEAIGRRMGLVGPELDRLLAAAQLHDLGKVAVPPEIFAKPGPLDDDERAIVGEHTVIGEEILRSVPEMAGVATIVRHSREHFDGGGYPDGLAGETIPLASRIVMCAAAFCAMRSERPYRVARSADDALAELEAFAGSQFDPDVVQAVAEVARDTRRAHADPHVVTILPRSRRLAALLLALTLGTGTALAAIPEARDLIDSIFGASAGPSDVVSTDDGRGFSFARLGELLRAAPVTAEAAKPPTPERAHPAESRSAATDTRDQGKSRGPRDERLEGPRDKPRQGGEVPGEQPNPGPGPGPVLDPGPGGEPPAHDPPVRESTPEAPALQEPPGAPDQGDVVAEPMPAPLDPAPTGKGTPPRKPGESPGRNDEAKEDGPAGRPENPGRPDPPGHASG